MNIKQVAIFFGLGMLWAVPVFVFGQNQLANPLANDVQSFGELFRIILQKVIIPLSVMVGVALIIWAGLMFVTAQGNSEKLAVAKKRLIYTLIGVAIVIGAEILLDLMLNTVKEITSIEI